MKTDRNNALLASEIPGLPEPVRGKVRDVYDVGDAYLFVATDRISAFDCVMPNGIPDKGKVLTQLSLFWFRHFDWMPNHVLGADVADLPEAAQPFADVLKGRSMMVRKVEMLPVECIARGYLVGSGWREYQAGQSVCGIPLRAGYEQAARLDKPIFTPSTKAEQGLHDQNISFERAVELIGPQRAEEIRTQTLRIYSEAAHFAAQRGIIIADTKIEFGVGPDGELIMADEVLTPDSSRFWPVEHYETGSNPPSLDKQFVRDYLESIAFDKTPPAPDLPDEIVAKTREKYIEALRSLTGTEF